MLSILLAIVLGLIVIFAGLLFYSPGTPELYLDKDGKPLFGSISEKSFVTIGGIRQGMFIRSKDISNPVLLYVHGGPAFPNYFLIEKYKPKLEDYFTVCYWEQRGGGLSYSPDIPLESMTFEQLTSDAIEVSNYLRKRFGKEKIYLMAHSGGTPIAIQAVVNSPEIYHAYMAMAQITNQSASENIAYKYITEQYTALGKTKELKELKKYPVLESESSIIHFYQSMIRDKSMHELGIGTMRAMKSVFWGVFIPVWKCKAYTVREKINIWVSKFTFIKKAKFVEQLFAYDIPSMFPKVEIPVYFFNGKYDLTVNIDLSKAYFEKLHAPVKGFYTFEHSAHSPLFEEPTRVREIIRKDVLNKKAKLVDYLINK
ncbi:MAG: alpha/beta hydrolase [Verrucomicrobia bacterium]|nr:alpha/beta hydrolase [Prolixibacteraceae bacterium]